MTTKAFRLLSHIAQAFYLSLLNSLLSLLSASSLLPLQATLHCLVASSASGKVVVCHFMAPWLSRDDLCGKHSQTCVWESEFGGRETLTSA